MRANERDGFAMSDLKALLSPDAGPVIQFIKYGICGGIATAVNIVIFHLLGWRLIPCLEPADPFVKYLRLTVDPLDQKRRARNSILSNTLAFLVSNFVAYLLNIYFVFTTGRHSWIVEIAYFYAVSGVSMALGTVLMGWLIRRYGLLTSIAFGSNIVTAMLINFVVRKFFIFAK
jgi:putative flippase GtrA